MEEIRFVETPRCTACRPDASFRRRRGCVGCEKLLPRPARARRPAGKPARRRVERETERAVLLLRTQGCSYGDIALRLGMPRATVQGVVRRCLAAHENGGRNENEDMECRAAAPGG